MKRITLVMATALLGVVAAQPAFARLSNNRLAGNRLASNSTSPNALRSGAVDEVSSIVLPNGEVLGR